MTWHWTGEAGVLPADLSVARRLKLRKANNHGGRVCPRATGPTKVQVAARTRILLDFPEWKSILKSRGVE